jgi:hypothetical protein
MSQARLRDMGASRQSLRQAIGHLDVAPAEGPRRARAREAAEPARPGHWGLIVIALGVLAAAAAGSLFIG